MVVCLLKGRKQDWGSSLQGISMQILLVCLPDWHRQVISLSHWSCIISTNSNSLLSRIIWIPRGFPLPRAAGYSACNPNSPEDTVSLDEGCTLCHIEMMGEFLARFTLSALPAHKTLCGSWWNLSHHSLVWAAFVQRGRSITIRDPLAHGK